MEAEFLNNLGWVSAFMFGFAFAIRESRFYAQRKKNGTSDIPLLQTSVKMLEANYKELDVKVDALQIGQVRIITMLEMKPCLRNNK